MGKHRDDGDGTFRTLSNGTVEYAISYGKDAYGKRRRKRFYGKNPAECRRQAKEFLKDVGIQKSAVTDYTLSQWLDRWLKSYRGKRIQAGQKQIQQSTLDEYQKYADRIKKHKIANVQLIDIKPIMIADFFNDNLSKYSYTVIKKTRFLLNAAFEAAVENDYCYKNPMHTAAIPQKAPGEKKAFPDEAFDTINEYALLDKDFGVCMLLLLHAGLRSEELRAIGPSDINGRIVTIDKAVKETGELGGTKNGKPRVVPLPPKISPLVHKRLNLDDKYILGGNSFVVKDTLRSKYNAFFKRLNKWCKENNKSPVERLPPHCCRHTYSTRARRKGIAIEIISALLGHSEKEVTEGYTHLDTIKDLTKATNKL
nr:site-specific integrase [uncultured Caproiciproducens sp.]